MNQTRLTVTTPEGVTAAVTVDTTQLESASLEAWDGLTMLLAGVIRKKAGTTNPRAWTWTAEPIGPQLRLVAVNGAVL